MRLHGNDQLVNAADSVNYTKLINKIYGQSAELLNVKVGGA
jgi:hypothetical protein